ncbi:MAG: tetratricopeptide repeat protein [Gaiella sp.]
MRDLALDRFEEACAHDRAGREHDAIASYRAALEHGLRDPQRPQALLGLGCALSAVRRHDDAIRVLAEAVEDYPEHAGLRFFHALALRSGGREREAFRALGRVVLDEADLRGSDRAAALALEHLD